MLSNRKKRIIEICAFILTLSFSLIIFNPLSSYIEKLITAKKQDIISMIGEKTGIGFDYTSISPSIGNFNKILYFKQSTDIAHSFNLS